MDLRKILNISISLVLLAACSKQNQSTSHLLNFDDAATISPDSLVDSVNVFHLEMQGDTYPLGIKNLFTSEDHIIVFDHRDVIFVYTNDGKYVSDSQKKIGKGEGEYTNATAVSYNKHSNIIEVLTPTTIMRYDLHFNFLDSAPLPSRLPDDDHDGIFFGTIYDISPNEHLLIPICFSDDLRQIYFYDSSTEKTNGIVDYGKGILANTTMQSQCFQPLSADTILFFPPGISNSIYAYSPKDNRINEYMHMNFGTNGISETDLKQFGTDEDRLRDFIMKTEKTVPLMSMAYKDLILTVTKIGSSLKNGYTIVWNPTTGKAYRLNTSVDGKPSFPIFDNVDENGIYTVIDSETYKEIVADINPKKLRMQSREIPDGSFVVMKYQLKDSI